MTHRLPDTGTQAVPHYCRHPADALSYTGCPRWPACVTLDADERADTSEDVSSPLGAALISAVGLFGGAALVLVVVWLLLPILLGR